MVVTQDGKSLFVEVKFRSDPAWLLKSPLLKQLKEFWTAKLILVTTTKPYFRVVDPQSLFQDEFSFEALEADPDLMVTGRAVEKCGRLVTRFPDERRQNHSSKILPVSVNSLHQYLSQSK